MKIFSTTVKFELKETTYEVKNVPLPEKFDDVEYYKKRIFRHKFKKAAYQEIKILKMVRVKEIGQSQVSTPGSAESPLKVV